MKFSRAILLTLMLLCGITLFAAIDPALGSQPLPQDPDVLSGTLPNGLKYYIQRNAIPESKLELRLFVNVGSIVEDEDQKGLAHFTEHMLFNGTRSFPKGAMLDFLNSVGMGFMNGLNGMTSYDFTMYMFSLPTEDRQVLERGFLLLSEMAAAASFEPEELERERGVIIEEWRMGQNADSRIQDQISSVKYAGSRYAERPPIGTYEVLSTFTRDQIVRFYQDWYRPDLQTVVVVGDIEPEDALDMLTRHFGSIPARENPRPREIFAVPFHEESRAVVATDREMTNNRVFVSWKKAPSRFQTMNDMYSDLQREIFYGMINSRLAELSRSATPPFSMGYAFEYSQSQAVDEINLLALTGETQTLSATQALLTEVERIRRYGFTEAELERSKLNILREYQSAMTEQNTRQSDQMTWGFFSTATRGSAYLSPEQSFALASALTPMVSLEECNAMIDRLIGSHNQVIAVQGVQKEGLNYPSPETLLSLAQTVEQTELEPYADTSMDTPLITSIPAPGQIVSSRTFPKSGIKQLTLSNGIKVYLKKTDFRADQVMITAVSPGGYSRLEPEYLNAARFLPYYLSESGLGDYSVTQLERYLAGKRVESNLEINLYNETLSGSCSPQDLETWFQLAYLSFTAPRWNDADLASVKARTLPYFINRDLDPETVFFDSLMVVSRTPGPYNDDLDAQALESVTLEQLRHVYEDRFADLGETTFYIVGNFDERQLNDLVKTYLATLPRTYRNEKPRDIGMRPLSGIKDVTFRKGGDNKSYVGLINTGINTGNPDQAVMRDAMLMVLNEKLRENIREDRSGVYFVQSFLRPERFPYPYYTMQTFMSCSADRVDELSDAILATIDSLKAGQYADPYVATVKVTLQQTYRERIRQNEYWISSMISAVKANRPIDMFLDHPARYESITKEEITAAAGRYLNTDSSLIKLVMYPELESGGE